LRGRELHESVLGGREKEGEGGRRREKEGEKKTWRSIMRERRVIVIH
jgi:hypothetical protein